MSRNNQTASTLLLALGLAAGIPAPAVDAQGPAPPAGATHAFDGIYIGVSAENDSRRNTLAGGRDRPVGYAGSRGCPTFRAPVRLTIADGVAEAKWADRTLRGSPTPQGALTMTTGYGQRFDGQIDSQYVIKGQLVGYCAYRLTWRKAH